MRTCFAFAALAACTQAIKLADDNRTFENSLTSANEYGEFLKASADHLGAANVHRSHREKKVQIYFGLRDEQKRTQASLDEAIAFRDGKAKIMADKKKIFEKASAHRAAIYKLAVDAHKHLTNVK